MRRRTLSLPAALAAGLVPLALSGCGLSTATYGTGEAPEMALMREMTGGLLNKNEKKKSIAYQPRAPLVMPPSGEQLPAPAETAEAVNPNWPVDPNERQLAMGDDDDNPQNDINQAEYRRLRPLASIIPGQSTSDRDMENGKADYYSNIVHGGRERRQQFSRALADANGLGSPTERRYLTEPPTEYRQPAPTAAAQYEEIRKKKKPNFFARLFGAS